MIIDLTVFEKDGELLDVLEILQGLKKGLRGQKNTIPVVKIHDKARRLTAYVSFSTDVKRFNEIDFGKEHMTCQLLKMTGRQK